MLTTYGSFLSVNGGHQTFVEIVKPTFLSLLRSLVGTVEVDEDWYLDTYPDVAEAVRSGIVSTAREHYRNSGYFEDRMPREITVDAAWYLAAYPDVASAIAERKFESAQQHFIREGFREGRLAARDWQL